MSAMTNGDKIRQMTDEELADIFCRMERSCDECAARKFCHKNQNGYFTWLKQEAQDADAQDLELY